MDERKSPARPGFAPLHDAGACRAYADRDLLVHEALVRDAYGAARDAELSGHVTPGRKLRPRV
jgi:hypothetical protein